MFICTENVSVFIFLNNEICKEFFSIYLVFIHISRLHKYKYIVENHVDKACMFEY